MEEKAVYRVASTLPPVPSLPAEAVITLVAEAMQLLKATGFRVLGWQGQPDALPPAHIPCQDLCASWQGPSVRFEATLTAYPTIGCVTFELQARLLGMRAETAQFYVSELANVRWLLDSWLPLHSEREKAGQATASPLPPFRVSPPAPPQSGSALEAAPL
jgi:hypothetical protein